MKLEDKTVDELKQMCKTKKISGYSKLLKKDLIKVLSKKVKGGAFPKNGYFNEEMKSQFNPMDNIETFDQFAASSKYFIATERDNPGLFNTTINEGKPNGNPYFQIVEYKNYNGINKSKIIYKDIITVDCVLNQQNIKHYQKNSIKVTGKVIGVFEDKGFILLEKTEEFGMSKT